MPSDESVTITPVLQSDEQTLALPSVVVNGSEKQKVYDRKRVLSANSRKEKRVPAPAVVLRNDSKAARAFDYKVSVPYAEWMKDAVLLLRSEECDCHGKAGKVFEDKIADGIRFTQPKTSPRDLGTDSRYLSLVNFIAPDPEKDTLHTVSGSIPFIATEGKSGKTLDKLSREKQNYEIYYRLRDAIREVRRQIGADLVAVNLTGYGAPVGNLHRNEHDCVERAQSLKEYLRENRAAGNSPIEVAWIPEDWDSIASIVKESDMLFRDATLDLIRNVDIVKGRERMLMKLADGAPYKYLAEKVFPQVKRVEYEISYTRRPLDAIESRRLFQSGSRALQLSEFFAVANSYPKGSTEYNDALDLAARLFPDSPEANINAAAVALTKRDAAKARKYLERFATLPMAYNNMGILYLLEGNRDKAEVYLQMAAANGVEEAKQALRTMEN